MAVASLLTTGAFAADLTPRPYTKAPPPVVAVYDWTGFYVGLNGGLGTLNNTFVGLGAFAPFAISSHVTDNIVRAGVNYKFGGPVVAKY